MYDDERDLDRRHREPGDRHEQLEEREARDRVEEVGEDADRRVEQAEAHAEQREHERDREADADGDQRELDVLHERRLKRVAPVGVQPVGAQPAVRPSRSCEPLPKFGMTGPPATTRSSRAGRPA